MDRSEKYGRNVKVKNGYEQFYLCIGAIDMNAFLQRKIEQLQAGITIVSREKGNSMLPKIKSMQPVKLVSVTDLSALQVGDIVFCKVHGNYYTHIVSARKSDCVQISNMKGHVNGWTSAVYGKVIQVFVNNEWKRV